MAEQPESRVAVYIDFDNIVISRYDQVHGRGAWRKDNVYRLGPGLGEASPEIAAKIEAATVDIGAIIDYATSFGTTVLSRAYADWSIGVNAGYQGQLMERAVDLTQLFPATAQMKNGADIRLAVDVVEDLFRLPDVTHVVIAAGDSDYIALAQRAKRLGRHVVGVGVAGGTSRSLAAACDEFADYDTLPGVRPITKKTATKKADTRETSPDKAESATTETPTGKKASSQLLIRALELMHERDDEDWLHTSELKRQMVRLDPAFNEKAIGYSTFGEFLASRANIAELDDSNAQLHKVRLRRGEDR
ncbi:NYN domain-containing protein [Microcella sp.]|uniref:NYN domain-containing protein n=1 Tax=Microcella sp. TaxID=1913979 RepID=UPI00391A704B